MCVNPALLLVLLYLYDFVHLEITNEELFEWLTENSDGIPVNLIYKQGLDEFKKFLIGTAGEKHLLLWISLEKSKHFEKEEQA